MAKKSITRGKPRIIVVLGPTASGKSSLAEKLAKRFKGEIISADSRQVYRGMDIGTAKIPRDKSIPYHLVDVASPKRQFTAAQFQKRARAAIKNIIARGKLPIVCGGTGHYVAALLGEQTIPEVPPNQKLRNKLAKLDNAQLVTILRKLDPVRARTIDPKNPRRLVRAIEIAIRTGKPVPLPPPQKYQSDYSHVLKNMRIRNAAARNGTTLAVLKLGLRMPDTVLRKRLRARLDAWLRRGLVAEVKRLGRSGVSSKRLAQFGLVYRSVGRYLSGAITKGRMVAEIERDLRHYAKNQMRWFRRDKTIRWVRKTTEAMRIVRRFVEQKE